MSGDLSLPVMLATGILPGLGARRAPASLWLPSNMFDPAAPAPGVWGDGDDNSVLSQDPVVFTPVTDFGQQIGLLLDKRLWEGRTLAQEIAARMELRANGAIGLVGTAGGATYTTATGAAVVYRGASAGNQSFVQWTGLNSLGLYRVDIENTGSPSIVVRSGGASASVSLTVAAGQRVTGFVLPGSGAITIGSGANNSTASFILHSAKHIPGNHLVQETAASRPVWQEDMLGARGFRFDGIDDFFVSRAAIDFSASDKVLVSAGLGKLSDAASGTVAEFSTGATSNNGAFLMRAPNGANPNYLFLSGGSLFTSSVAPSSYPSPISAVLTGLGDIGGDICRLRVNGTQVAQNTADQGAGNYGNYAVYIGMRAGASFPFNGFIHQLVVRGGAWPDAAELARLESFEALKSKVAA